MTHADGSLPWAVETMLKEEAVRRRSWAVTQRIPIQRGERQYPLILVDPITHLMWQWISPSLFHPFKIMTDDIFATDWECTIRVLPKPKGHHAPTVIDMSKAFEAFFKREDAEITHRLAVVAFGKTIDAAIRSFEYAQEIRLLDTMGQTERQRQRALRQYQDEVSGMMAYLTAMKTGQVVDSTAHGVHFTTGWNAAKRMFPFPNAPRPEEESQ